MKGAGNMYTIEDDFCNTIRMDENGKVRRYRDGKPLVFQTKEEAQRALDILLQSDGLPAWIEKL